jgi:molybdopterin-guanine dinucleotide biosynthesis protein A
MMDAVRRKIRCGGRPMTAIVLAGGRGRRMRADKAGLDVGGVTLLEHVLGQIAPYFDEILISISPGQRPAPRSGGRRPRTAHWNMFSGASAATARFVEDETPGLGPLGGILSGLKAAMNDACAVVACDIPEIDLPLLRLLARAAREADIAVLVGPSGFYEPLFAVYRASIVPEIEAFLGGGEHSILPLFDRCRTVIVQFEDARRVRNLNTRGDYETYLGVVSKGAEGRPGRRSGGGRRDPSKGRI